MLRALAALALTALAATHAPAARAQVTDFTLQNGLQVVVIEDHRAPAAVHMIWYRAGAAEEEQGASGVAHYLEHLLFKATETMEAGEFSRFVSPNGGSDNAFTSYDYTAYFQRVSADLLSDVMRMEADRMTNLNIRQEDILVERDVVIEERAQRTDSDPGALLGEQRQAAMYLNHPYGRPVIGWRHEMVDMSLEDVLAFYEAHYAPNNAVVVVAGDVTPEEVRALAETHYGPIPANPDIAVRERPQEPPQTAERRLAMEDPRVGQPYLVRSYLVPERDAGDQEEAAVLTMLAQVLGGSPTTSVLGRRMQVETGEAVWTSASYRGVSYDDTTFGLVVVPSEGVSLEEAEAALDRELAAFAEGEVDEGQLERLKFQIRASEIYEEDAPQGRARKYGAALTSGLTLADVEAWPALLDAVTGDEIVEAAQRLLDRRASVTSYLRPPAAGDAASPEAAPAPAAEEVPMDAAPLEEDA